MFYPIFHCGLLSRAVNIAGNLCTKPGISSLKSAVYNQERVIMACVRYLISELQFAEYLRFVLSKML